MFRPAVTAGRALLRHSSLRPSLVHPVVTNTTRSLGTQTSKKSNFKSTAVRWALAGGIVYWYATSNVFADEPKYFSEEPNDTSPDDDDRPPSLLPEHSLRSRGSTHKTSDAEDDHLVNASDAINTKDRGPSSSEEPNKSGSSLRGPEELEEEAGQEGAFNPETGEINWDCPCLGGMAHGPCGEEFKTAFSCFVFSTEDPKGVDCIDKFKGMQTCFQQHPEVYGSELDGDGDDDELDPTDDIDKPTETTTTEAHSSHPDTRSSLSPSPPVETSPDTSSSPDASAPPTRTAKNGPATGASRNDEMATPKRNA